MQVGDLVKFKNDGQLGLVVGVVLDHMGVALDHLGDTMYTISWMDGHVGNRWADELEVINASR